MYLAYFDESGDSGITNSPTTFFVLACVLVHHADWKTSLDSLVELRRKLRTAHDIPTTKEIKAIHIRRGQGVLANKHWSMAQRMKFFHGLMRYTDQNFSNLRIFAVAVDKQGALVANREPRETAWEFAIQRVSNFCNVHHDVAMIFPDEGHAQLVRRLVRRMRRFNMVPRRWGGGSFSVRTERIIEDPNDRASQESYFIQLADWCAFACHRSRYIDPRPAVSDQLWDLLGGRLELAVNKVTGGPPAIKLYP